MEAMIDAHLRSSIQFHDVLHGFHAGRGTGTATMELKQFQGPIRVNQYPLLLVLLDLRKAYNTVDFVCLIRILEDYVAVPHMCDLLETF